MMVRALAWKEWREQRAVVLTGLLLAVALPPFILAGMSLMGSRVDTGGLAQALPVVYAGLLWPLFAAAAGAGTIAAEVGNGTLGFLLSRPASRARIWSVKIAIAFLSAALVAAGSLAIAAAFGALAGTNRSAASGEFAASPGILVLLAAISLVFFSAAAFLSTLLERTMTAAAGGVAASMAMVTAIGAIWTRLDLVPRFEPEWLTLEYLFAGLAILPAALYVFARGELLRGAGARRAALMGGAAVIAASALVSVPIFWRVSRLDAAEAILWDPTLSPSRDAVVATASASDGTAVQVWWIPTDGSGPQRRAGRLTFGPAFAGPQGLVYLSQRGLLGMRSTGGAELRWQDLDSAEDRALAAGLRDYLPPAEFIRYVDGALLPSPGGERVAVSMPNRIVVAERDGGMPRSVDLSGTALEGGVAVGWTPAGDALVLFRSRWGDAPEAVLGVYDLGSRSVRAIFHTAERVYFPYWKTRAPNRRGSVLLQVSESGENRIIEVDLASGAARTLIESPCPHTIGTDEQGEILAYSTCSEEPGLPPRSEIHLLDRRTREDRVLGSVAGSVGAILLSPAADRALLRLNGPGGMRAAIVGGGMPAVTIAGVWDPIGWTGKDQVVLRGWGEPTPLVVASAEGKVLRSLLP